MSSGVAGGLLEGEMDYHPGRAQPGFRQSEERPVIGGHAWRKFDPIQPSQRWGVEYECWEASGMAASGLFRQVEGLDVRPSRIDVAWDFVVDDAVTADVVAEALRPYVTARGISEGVSGQGGINTRYIGSPASDRRIRIYRRDAKDPALYEELRQYVLRVELVLRKDHARAAWSVLREQGRSPMFDAVAAHVADLAGLEVQPDAWDAPPVPEASSDADAAQLLYQFMQQHGPTLHALHRAGVPVQDLAARFHYAASLETRRRAERKVSTFIEAMRGGSLVRRVLQILVRCRRLDREPSIDLAPVAVAS